MEAMNSSRRRTLGNISETLEQYNHIQKGLIQISDFVSVHKSEVNYSVPGRSGSSEIERYDGKKYMRP